MATQTFQQTLEAQLGQLTYRCAVLGQTILDLQDENARLKAQLNVTPMSATVMETNHG